MPLSASSSLVCRFLLFLFYWQTLQPWRLASAFSSVPPPLHRPIRTSFLVATSASSTTTATTQHPRQLLTSTRLWSSSSSSSGYSPPQGDERNAQAPEDVAQESKKLYPKAGDFVLYYDLDGGDAQGQVLVGRIRFISKTLGGEGSGWTLELTEMEALTTTGDNDDDNNNDQQQAGYYIELSSRQRWAKGGSTYRDLGQVRPLSASFVRSQNAYKVPTRASDGTLIPKADRYDIDGYEGPFADPDRTIDTAVVEADQVLYQALKGKLLKYAALTGTAGAIVADLVRGTEAAVIYSAGVVASLLYLFFLSLKTDTLGTERAGFGKNVSNLRFATPVVVILGVALFNASRGDLVGSDNLFSTVTPQQFAAAVLGFLTYRLPLIFIQVEGAFASSDDNQGEGVTLPGSAGVALQLAQGQQAEEGGGTTTTSALDADATTIFLISGPQSTGRPALVQQLVNDNASKFVQPTRVDKVTDGATFERLEQRGEFLDIAQDRYGLTKQALVDAGQVATDQNQILVVDANVELAKALSATSGLRLVGVWVGLGSVKEFEERLEQQVDDGRLPVEEGETKESTVRGKIREIVKEIEYGISSGIFEFTVLNDDTEMSLKQLREAAKYVNE